MKWWQLTWLFGTGENVEDLREVLSTPEWPPYLYWLDKLDLHVQMQWRDILDSVVPDALVEKALPKVRWYYIVKDGYLRGGWREPETVDGIKPLSALDTYRKYG